MVTGARVLSSCHLTRNVEIIFGDAGLVISTECLIISSNFLKAEDGDLAIW